MAPVEVDEVRVDNDEFFEEDPFQEAEEEDAREVGEEDIEDAEYEEEEVEEELVPALPPIAEKAPAKTVVAKKDEGTKLLQPKAPIPNKAGPLAEWEQFKLHKFNEADMRDTGAKAICKIKYCLRQPGSQSDGKPCIPPDWDTRFKPVLGPFKRFILTRPDQFRIITGAEPGVYTIARVSTEVVVPPSLDSKGKGKKGKGKVKGKFGDDGKGKGKWGKGKEKGKGKGKDKGKGKAWGKPWGGDADAAANTGSKAWGAIAQAVPAVPDAAANAAQATRASRLLAAAARDALAEEQEAKEQEEKSKEAEDEETADGAAAEAEAAEEMADDEWLPDDEEEAPEPDEDPIEKMWKPTPESGDAGEADAEGKDDDDDMYPADKPANHGSFISTLLSGSLLSGGAKRPRLAA